MERWLIISWRHNDLMDGCFGELLNVKEGSYEEACEMARAYIPYYSPVGVVREVLP